VAIALLQTELPAPMIFGNTTFGRAIVPAFILASASFANAAAVTDYMPTRDTYMRGANDPQQPQLLNGTSPSGRTSKSFLDFYITDFDRTTINAFINGQLGHAMTIGDMPNVKLSLHLFSNDSEGYQPTQLSRPAVFLGTEDWVEGTNDTLGATKNFAVYDPANPANNRTWKNAAGTDVQWFLQLDKIENAAFEEWGGDPFTYRSWLLDDNVAFAYLTEPLARGLFLNASDADNAGGIEAQYSNAETYSRDATDETVRPFLEVIVVPEAQSLILLGWGTLMFARPPRRPSRS